MSPHKPSYIWRRLRSDALVPPWDCTAAHYYHRLCPQTPSTKPCKVGTAVLCSGSLHQRDPALYSGTDDHDAEDWLTSYEVNIYKKWDNATKLNNVIFYPAVPTSGIVITKSSSRVGHFQVKTSPQCLGVLPCERCARTEQRVCECSQLNTHASETDKIKNTLKGIEDDAFSPHHF